MSAAEKAAEQRLVHERVLVCVALALALGGCEREARRFQEPASKSAPAESVRLSQLEPGGATPAPQMRNRAEDNAYAVSQGQRLFTAFNCVGCHAHGGGSIGPALMDDKWIYGHEPQNVYASIVQGRPNGMPAFGGRIPEAQVWQIVAYVRSMAGYLGSATAPSRTDSMSAAGPEATRDPQTPRPMGTPPR
jgi:cytochrome c oxidase cbb3-type subunit 3